MAEHEEQESLWLEESAAGTSHLATWRHLWVVFAAVACVAALAVPVALALSSGGPPTTPSRTTAHVTNAAAKRAVLSALSATTNSGSFNVSYRFDPPTSPTVATTTTTSPASTCTTVSVGGSGPISDPLGTSLAPSLPSTATLCSNSVVVPNRPSVSVTGTGTVDTDPFAMLAVSDVSGLGQITIRDNGTKIWEYGGADYGLAGASSQTGTGASLSGFAGLVEGTLGPRQGALAMGGLASPTGYLNLDQSMISAADQTGTGTVDGVPVTIYEVSISPAQEATVANTPGISTEQAKAITDSVAVLKQQGYTGTTVQISIDASGFIRQTRSVAHFADGSKSASEATFSDFGCAGTVLMPGQSGPTAPPAGCVSPDTGIAPTTTTTSTVPPSSTTTSTSLAPPTTSTTGKSTTTTVNESPSSTTSTTGATSSTTTTTGGGVSSG